MWQACKIVGQICKNNFFTILGFSCLYHLAFYGAWQGIILLGRISQNYWGQGVGEYCYWFCFFLLVCFFVLWEIGSFLFLFRRCDYGGHISPLQMAKEGFSQVILLCRPENIWLIPFLLLVLPLQFIVIWSSLFLSFTIPDFILQFLGGKPVLLWAANLGLFAVQILGIESLFLFHYLFLWQKPVRSAFSFSRKMGIKRLSQTALVLCLWNMVWTAGGLVFYQGEIWLYLLGQGETPIILGEYLLLFLQHCFFVPVSIAIVHSFYLLFLQGEGGAACRGWLAVKKKISSYLAWGLCLAAVLVYGNYLYGQTVRPGGAVDEKMPVIAAHRGYGKDMPENTIGAVAAAKEAGVSCIEIDTQMTRDGQLIVFHDRDLSHVLGVAKATPDVDYGWLKERVARQYAAIAAEKRPLPPLKEVLTAGGAEMAWNIELKVYASPMEQFFRLPGLSGLSGVENKSFSLGQKQQMAAAVVTLLQEMEQEKQIKITSVVISSLDYEMLQLVKNIAPEIKTLYILPFARGSLPNLPAADGYSIEATALTPSIYQAIKDQGKTIWVWTVNRGETAAKLWNYEIDGMVTDQPELIQGLYESRSKRIFRGMLPRIFW